jgi:beta-phosphoglucomutase
MIENIKGIIFDLDGVIVKTDYYHYLAWKEVADKEGIYFDEKINHHLRGLSREDSLEFLLNYHNINYPKAKKEEMLTEKNNLYISFLENLNPKNLEANVLDVLLYFKEKKLKLAIASSSKNAKLILAKLKITKLFDVIVDGNDIKEAKPNPEIFIKAQQNLSLKTDECVVIEDATSGIDAANAANIISIGIGPASKYEKTQIKINKITDLIDIINI